MTGGNHARYITNGKFSWAKWTAVQDSFNTPAIRTGLAAAVQDSTVPFVTVMDEPNHSSWGGNVRKSTVDSMSRYVKGIFPTVKTQVAVAWDWQKSIPYTSLDVAQTQYSLSKGDVRAYIDSAVTTAARNHVGLALSMNILNGGTQVLNCPIPSTGGVGTLPPGCKMNPTQLDTLGTLLAQVPQSCVLMMWQYDPVFMAIPANRAAFQHVASVAALRPFTPCGR
jgi:hypothetical protein